MQSSKKLDGRDAAMLRRIAEAAAACANESDGIGVPVCDVAPWIPAPWRRWHGDSGNTCAPVPDECDPPRRGCMLFHPYVVYDYLEDWVVRCRPDSRGTTGHWPRCE